MNYESINYKKPKAILLNESGIGIAEFAGRIAYNSFDKSENEKIKNLKSLIDKKLDFNDNILRMQIKDVRDIENSELLNKLAWVYFHHSVLEHIYLTYYIKTSRGVLQELARHRIQSLTVQSTRYTMGPVLYAYVIATNFTNYITDETFEIFSNLLDKIDFLILDDKELKEIEYKRIFDMLLFHNKKTDIYNLILTQEQEDYLINFNYDRYINDYIPELQFIKLQKLKQKRNVGDPFKYLVTDNWSVELVTTWNLRSLKNFFDLRDNNSAYFYMQETAKAMKLVTPIKYLKLIDKKVKDERS